LPATLAANPKAKSLTVGGIPMENGAFTPTVGFARTAHCGRRPRGYSLHLIVESTYELPVGFSVTKANSSEVVEAHHLLNKVQGEHPDLAGRCGSVAADLRRCEADWQDLGGWKGLAVIDIRNCWRDGETTKVATGCENVAYGGLERDRGTLKYRCPAEHYGIECAGRQRCPFGP
jgi:hypothetical protein